jgi:hypothetical protein
MSDTTSRVLVGEGYFNLKGIPGAPIDIIFVRTEHMQAQSHTHPMMDIFCT